MALQGVNLPLAFTGQEAIWQKVFKVRNWSSSIYSYALLFQFDLPSRHDLLSFSACMLIFRSQGPRASIFENLS